MPSDPDHLDAARRALAGPIEAFHSALAATLEDVRADEPGAGGGRADDGVDLGRFAAGRIDLDRFAAVLERGIDTEERCGDADGLRLARETLLDLEARADDLLRVDVPAGTSLRDAVAAALSAVGRAFGAARVIDRVRAVRYESELPAAELMGLPFARWSRTERRRAPPLIVTVAGADLHADALAEFLDGHVRLVLLVSGEAPPAPLARLITPGVFVLQATNGTGLEGLAALADWDGPGIAAVLPDGAATFVHDPDAGADLGSRLRIDHLPDAPPAQTLGGLGAGQRAEPLAHLRALAALVAEPAATPAATPAASPTDPAASAPAAPRPAGPADQLAAWLLSHADLTETP